jgi:hypothetical protein
MNLREFRVMIGANPTEAPECRQITYSISLTEIDGVLIQKERDDLVFDGLLGDPDQLPWLIAHALRSLMAEGEEHTLKPRPGPILIRRRGLEA